MSETTLPAAEAEAVVDTSEVSHYELAFHVLPTVAEGEVASVFETVKNHITTAGGTVTDEEMAERFDLAYEVVKHIEGKNRKFTSAYFGWVRFTAPAETAPALDIVMGEQGEIMRHLLIRLSRVEAEFPFRFHEALEAQKMATTVGDAAPAAEPEAVAPSAESGENKEEASTTEPAAEEKSKAETAPEPDKA